MSFIFTLFYGFGFAMNSNAFSEPSIKVIENAIEIAIPSNISYEYVRIFQSEHSTSFFWDNGGSKFYQCNDDGDACTPIVEDVTYDMDGLNQAAGFIKSNPQTGNHLVFKTPKLAYPEYGVFPMSFYVLIKTTEGNLITRPLDIVVYKTDPISSSFYTFLPTTICKNGGCQTTSVPYLKDKIIKTVNGVATTLETFKTISYNPVTVQSYLTTNVIVTSGIIQTVVTYCPLTDN